MEALNNILNRVSARNLKDPHPSVDEMQSIYKAALRAPDHAWLRPSSFIEVKGTGISRLSKIFEEYADTVEDLKEEIKEKYKMAPFRAPMIIILVNTYKEHPKVPEIEQKLSTAAAAQNILLSLNAIGYAGIWRTGILVGMGLLMAGAVTCHLKTRGVPLSRATPASLMLVMCVVVFYLG